MNTSVLGSGWRFIATRSQPVPEGEEIRGGGDIAHPLLAFILG